MDPTPECVNGHLGGWTVSYTNTAWRMIEWIWRAKGGPMNHRRKLVALGLVVLVFAASLAGFAQEPTSVPETVRQSAGSALDQILTFIDSASNYLGQGVVYLLNLVTGDRVSSDLEKPIGYLALITVILLVFGLLDVARRIIWIGIIVGWALLVVRVILDALNL